MFNPKKTHFPYTGMRKAMFERIDSTGEVGPEEFQGHSVVSSFAQGSRFSNNESSPASPDLINATRIFSSILAQHQELYPRTIPLYDIFRQSMNSHLSAEQIFYISSFFEDLTNLISCCNPDFSMDESTMQNLNTLTERSSVEVYQVVDLFFQFAAILEENSAIIQEYIQNLNAEQEVAVEEEEQQNESNQNEQEQFVFSINYEMYKQITEQSGDTVGEPIMPCDVQSVGIMPSSFTPFKFYISCPIFDPDVSSKCADVGLFSLFTALKHIVYGCRVRYFDEEQDSTLSSRIQAIVDRLVDTIGSSAPEGYTLHDVAVESLTITKIEVPCAAIGGISFLFDVVYTNEDSSIVRRLIPSDGQDALLYLIQQFLPSGFRCHRSLCPFFNYNHVEETPIEFSDEHPFASGCVTSSDFDPLVDNFSEVLESFIADVGRVSFYADWIERELASSIFNEQSLRLFFAQSNLFQVYTAETYVLFSLCICLVENQLWPLPCGSFPSLRLLEASVYNLRHLFTEIHDPLTVGKLETLIPTLRRAILDCNLQGFFEQNTEEEIFLQ